MLLLPTIQLPTAPVVFCVTTIPDCAVVVVPTPQSLRVFSLKVMFCIILPVCDDTAMHGPLVFATVLLVTTTFCTVELFSP